MQTVVLVAGMAQRVPLLRDADYIGVDKGAMCCLRQGIPMVMAIGDFDSIDEDAFAQLKVTTAIQKLAVHKNETDSEEAIRYAMQQGYQNIILYGGLGGRVDHALANLYLLLHRQLPITLMDEHNVIKVITKGVYRVKKTHAYLSFLALEKSCISEEGVAYPLCKQEVTPNDIYTVSNEIRDVEAIITVHYGRFIMMQCEDAVHHL